MKMGMAVAELDEYALVARARSGDRAAFTALVERHYDFIFGVAWRWSANHADAEDIAQETCIRIARSISGYRGEGGIRTWIYRLVLSAAHDAARKTTRERRKAEAFHAQALIDGQGAVFEGDTIEELWDAVRELPEKQRDAILLVHGEDLSHAEAAIIMGCKESTVSWHIHEGRKKLKHLMRANGDG
jgi:RNA polymerase sigma-70 factor (ECF subfamily)